MGTRLPQGKEQGLPNVSPPSSRPSFKSSSDQVRPTHRIFLLTESLIRDLHRESCSSYSQVLPHQAEGPPRVSSGGPLRILPPLHAPNGVAQGYVFFELMNESMIIVKESGVLGPALSSVLGYRATPEMHPLDSSSATSWARHLGNL